MEDLKYHRLRLADVIAETGDAHSLVFELPGDLRDRFAYKPGQFLTLRIPSTSGALARCYSLASSPHADDALKVTVKRVAEGAASNWICDNLKAGDEVEVLPPAGVFTPHSLDGDFLLFAGGSGITPVMSIVKSALLHGEGRIVLIYANRDEKSVIFRGELDALARRHPDRLTVVHWLETVQGLPSVDLLAATARPWADHECFICGPGIFMDCVVEALHRLGVARERIHVERFVSLAGDPLIEAEAAKTAFAMPSDGPVTRVEVFLDSKLYELDWPADRHLLDVLLAEGIDAPHSCRMGSCSACMCQLEDGDVRLDKNTVLDKTDLAENWILACQAIPLTDKVKVRFPT